jgi:hypothetical protein
MRLAYDGAAGYAGGQMYDDATGFNAVDLAFRINVPTAAAAPISPLGLLSIFLAIGAVGAFGARKKQLAVVASSAK